MNSPVLSDQELPGDNAGQPSGKQRILPWMIVFLLIAIPVIVTLIGVVTAPPHVSRVPTGRIVYMDADEPSDHTTNLRGMRITLPASGSHLLVHETEPQDTDSGSREWINEPAVSPDGTQTAFLKQVITLQEEQNSVVNQIWIMPLTTAQPRLLLDLTSRKLKMPVGLAWTPDGKNITFLEDTTAYRVSVSDPPTVSSRPLAQCPVLKTNKEISATRSPTYTPRGNLVYSAQTLGGPQIVGLASAPIASIFALSPDGQKMATVNGKSLILTSTESHTQPTQMLPLHWGWSIFGGRHVTSLHWSPDGRFVGYTVSKPPVPEDEVFYLEISTGKTYQMPMRTGRAGWDWTR